jgi:hypothetical protein
MLNDDYDDGAHYDEDDDYVVDHDADDYEESWHIL